MQHQVMRGMRGYAFSLPTPSIRSRRQWHRFALGDRLPDLDATALHLEVGKRFCRLLALDDEDSAIDGLTPSRSLRKASRPPGQLEPLRRPL
jgi:hypothetical protein